MLHTLFPMGVLTMSQVDERRDSPRIPCVLGIRFPGTDDAFQQTVGTVSMGGVDFVAPKPAPESALVVEVLLPGNDNPIRATAVPLFDLPEIDHRRISASFIGLDVQTELALARWMQEQQGVEA